MEVDNGTIWRSFLNKREAHWGELGEARDCEARVQRKVLDWIKEMDSKMVLDWLKEELPNSCKQFAEKGGKTGVLCLGRESASGEYNSEAYRGSYKLEEDNGGNTLHWGEQHAQTVGTLTLPAVFWALIWDRNSRRGCVNSVTVYLVWMGYFDGIYNVSRTVWTFKKCKMLNAVELNRKLDDVHSSFFASSRRNGP